MKRLFGKEKTNKPIKGIPGSPVTEPEVFSSHNVFIFIQLTAPYRAINTCPTFPFSMTEREGGAVGYAADDHWDVMDADKQNHLSRSGISSSHPANPSALSGSSPLSNYGSLHNVTPFTPTLAPIPLQIKSQHQKERDRDPQAQRKKPHNDQKVFNAIGILKALDPHAHPDPLNGREQSEDGVSLTEHSSREERKERRNFWERTNVKDKVRDAEKDRDRERDKDRDKDTDREKERARDKEKKEEDATGEVAKMIGACC